MRNKAFKMAVGAFTLVAAMAFAGATCGAWSNGINGITFEGKIIDSDAAAVGTGTILLFKDGVQIATVPVNTDGSYSVLLNGIAVPSTDRNSFTWTYKPAQGSAFKEISQALFGFNDYDLAPGWYVTMGTVTIPR